jgi:hypothetical protein
VLTHANGDHTHGGQLLPGSVRVIAAERTYSSELKEIH